MRMYLLDKKQRVRRWLKDNDFVEAEMTEEINAANQINFSLPLKERVADNIYYVAIPTPRSKQRYLLFKLLSEQVKNDRIEYQGIEEAYDELKQYGYIKDVRPNERTAEEMLQMVLKDTRWSLGDVPETNQQSTNFYYISYLEALQKIVGLFSIELTFEVTIDPKSNKITRRQVNVYKQQGQRTGKRFEYGSNLLTVEQEQNSQELITALVGRGKGEQVSEGTDGSPDGYGRRITFADVVWSKENGNPIDKPAGQEYLVDPEATELYGFSDGSPRIGLTVFEDIEDPIELINATWQALQSLKRPKVSFKANVTDVGKLGLGDTVAIIRHDLKIEYFTRVYKVKHNLLNENDNQIELGDDFSGHSITSSILKVDGIANEAKEAAGHAAIAANGKNNNYYSSVQPLAPIEGDIWYKDLGNGEVDMYQYHNGGWVFIQSTRDLHIVQNQVKEAQSGLIEAKQQIEANKKLADQDIERLNKSVGSLESQYGTVTPDLNRVSQEIAEAMAKYHSAKQIVSDLQNQATKQGKNIADITKTVDGLNINYANLLGDVNATKIDVKGLQTTLGTANGDINQLKIDAQHMQNLLAGKVDNSTYTNFVNLTNQALAAKLTASDLNGYAKTVDVEATANGLRVDMNSVTDRLNNLRIGGRNLITNSSNDIVIESRTTDPYPAWKYQVVYWNLTPNMQYTFSTSATNTNDVKEASMRVFNEAKNKEVGSASFFFLADGKRHSKTFSVPDDGVQYSVYLYAGPMSIPQGKNFITTYHHPKLEIGTIASDWSPAPEDTEHRLTELSSRITANTQQFSSYYTKSETDNRTNSAKNDAVNAIKNDGNWQGLSNILTNSGFLQSADGFLQKVQQTTIPIFNGGGVNLVKDTSESEISGKAYEIKHYWFSEPLEPNTKYTISVDAKVDQEALNHQQFVFIDPYTDDWSWSALMSCVPANLNYQHYKYTFITPDVSKKVTNISVYLAHADGKSNDTANDSISGTGYFKKLKVERGEIATPYSQAPSDNTTAFTELAQSLEGLRSTVSGNYGTLQSLNSQTATAIRNEVTDKVNNLQGQITTQANNINLAIGSVGDLSNICRNPDFVDGKTDGWENVSSSSGNGSSPSKYYGGINHRDGYYGNWFSVATGDKYYFSVYAWQDVSSNNFNLGLVYEKKDGTWTWQSAVSFNPNENLKTKYGTITIPNNAVKAKIWVQIDATANFGNWWFTNVVVKKNDTLAQINMSAGTTLIQNDKIFMDASSTIFSGNAFIPSAAITSLNADKITTGTLNAANVNIINLNANNITTGTINGQNLKINLNSGNVEFQHGRIHSFNNNVDINIDQNYISTANWNTRALLKDGELQLTQPNIFDTNGNWYFRLYNGGGAGDAWAGASLVGRDSVIVANEANAQGATGFTSSPMGTATFSGLFTGKGTNKWMPTVLGGAERGVFIKGGNQMSIKHNIMDPNDGGVFTTGSPYISVGVDGPNNNWWGNRIVLEGEYVHIPTAWRHITGAGPNLVVAEDGALVRSTSASKYKTDIRRDYSTNYGDKLLSLPTATWIDKGQKERYEAGKRHIKPEKFFGMIAEDLADAGLDLLVSRTPDGEIEGIQYERIGPALIPVIKKLKDKVDKLEEKLNEQSK